MPFYRGLGASCLDGPGRATLAAMRTPPGITALESAQGPTHSYIAFVHGIMGSGMNWRAFARKLIATSPGRGALLVDLALHGELRDAGPLVPNTVEATAQEMVARLVAGGWTVDALAGHSFGGKVVTLAAQALPQDRARELWVLDSPPGPRSQGEGSASTLQVLAALRRIGSVFAARADFVEALEGRGVPRSVAQWLATNLRARPEGAFRFALDLVGIEAVLEDFFECDAWPTIDTLAQSPLWDLSFVYGGRSSVFVPEQLRALQERADAQRVKMYEIPKAGHWLHVDAPAQLLEIMGD